MHFAWTEEQQRFREDVVEFAKSLPDDSIKRDKSGDFSKALWTACADWGVQGVAVPTAYGGRERGDIMIGMLAMEAMGYGCRDLGLLFGLSAQMWTVQTPLVKFGTEEQKHRFLPPLCQGQKIAAHALTEPEAGSDAFALSTQAVKVDGGYRITGKKKLITLAPIADVALVFATVDPTRGRWGVTGFLVERDTPGFSTSASFDKMGLRTVPIGEINLDDCFVPDENRLGAEGAGFFLTQQALEYDRCGIMASQVGAMERQLEDAVDFARNRKQFGQPIGGFQSVSNRLADMKMRLETARMMLYKVAWLKQGGKPAMMEAAILKLHLSECFVASSMDAIRTRGGVGYLSDEGVERDLRDSVGGVLYAGTSDIQRNIISRMLGL